MTVKVITNNHPREVLDGWHLTPAEREQFDYVDWDAVDKGEDSATFFRYRGELYDLGDILRAEGEIAALGWDGFNADSFFSGMAVRLVDEGEAVIVARIYAD